MHMDRPLWIFPLRSCWRALALAALGMLALGGCKSGDGGLLIGASVAAFRPGAMPAGLLNVTVAVGDPSTGLPERAAEITVNGTALVNYGDGKYAGTVDIGPGAPITLVVKANGTTVQHSTAAFATFPALDSPQPGPLPVFCAAVVSWSPGSPPTASTYGLGILDSANPNGGLIWPNADLQQLPLGTTSYTIPSQTLTEGDRIILLGLVNQTPIPEGADQSFFLLGGFDAVRVQTTATPNLTSISVSPPVAAIPSGSSVTLTALGGYCDSTRNDVTASATWDSSSGVVQLDASSAPVVAAAMGAGSSTVTAALGSISGSAVVNVRGAVRDSGKRSMLDAVAGSATLLVAAGEGGLILTSPDGKAWTSRVSGTTASIQGLVWSGTKFVAVGDTGLVLTSPDGVTWTARASGTTSALRAVTWTGSSFVAVGDGGLVLTSLDGVAWTSRNSGIDHDLWAVAWSGSRLVTVGDVLGTDGYYYTTVLTSPDGITWTRQSGPTGGLWGLTGLASSGSLVVATSDQGDLLTSADGTSWTVVGAVVEPGMLLLGATWTGTRFVVVGTDGVMLASDDGASWAPLLTPGWTSAVFGTVELRAVTPLGDQLVAVGSSGAVVTSF